MSLKFFRMFKLGYLLPTSRVPTGCLASFAVHSSPLTLIYPWRAAIFWRPVRYLRRYIYAVTCSSELRRERRLSSTVYLINDYQVTKNKPCDVPSLSTRGGSQTGTTGPTCFPGSTSGQRVVLSNAKPSFFRFEALAPRRDKHCHTSANQGFGFSPVPFTYLELSSGQGTPSPSLLPGVFWLHSMTEGSKSPFDAAVDDFCTALRRRQVRGHVFFRFYPGNVAHLFSPRFTCSKALVARFFMVVWPCHLFNPLLFQ